MQGLEDAIDALADRTRFSGVVRVDRSGSIELAKAYGLADRRHRIRNTIDTQFALASGSKGLTALTVVSLIEDGSLDLATTARSLLGGDLPLIRDDVTIEHLLSHRSGIGDYLHEEAHHEITDYVMPVPVHELATTEQYLAVLGGHPTAFSCSVTTSSSCLRSLANEEAACHRRGRESNLVPSRSSRSRVIGHAPSDVFEITVCVVVDEGSCMQRNETPASCPSNITTSVDAWSQKPRPYRLQPWGTSPRDRTISAPQSLDTMRPAKNALHKELMSAAVE